MSYICVIALCAACGLIANGAEFVLPMEFIGSCIIKDGSIEPADEQSHIGDDNEVYEVLRIESGHPLFLADHLARWRSSMRALGRELPKWTDSFDTVIGWLIACNTLPDCDMRIVASSDGGIQCGYVETVYPSSEMYRDGVKVELLHAEREKPRLKIFHAGMRSEAGRQQANSGAYESLLVNKDGYITEGSRSNVYFITKQGGVCTAPDADVLGGIMRKHILDICKAKGVEVNFQMVKTEEISNFDSAFLSSTPMRILPIKEVDAKAMNVNNSALRLLMDEMENLVAEQIKA